MSGVQIARVNFRGLNAEVRLETTLCCQTVSQDRIKIKFNCAIHLKEAKRT